jgi:hypothetical protein
LAELKTKSAIDPREKQKEQCDDRHRLGKKLERQNRRSPVAAREGAAMEANQGGRKNHRDGGHVEPHDQILGKEKVAERQEIAEQSQHVEVALPAGLDEFERHEHHERAQTGIDAEHGSVGESHAANPHRKQDYFRRQRWKARCGAIEDKTGHRANEEKREHPSRQPGGEGNGRESQPNHEPQERCRLDHAGRAWTGEQAHTDAGAAGSWNSARARRQA